MSVIAVLLMAGTAVMCVMIPADTEGETPLTSSTETVVLHVDQGLSNENIRNLQMLGIENPTDEIWNYNGDYVVFTMDHINFLTTARIGIEFISNATSDIYLNLILVGENKIGYGPSVSTGKESVGIQVSANSTGKVNMFIAGNPYTTGSLDISCIASQRGYESFGINTAGNLTVAYSVTTLKASAADIDTDFINNSMSVGINAGTVKVTYGAKIIAKGGNITHDMTGKTDETASSSMGIMCDTIAFDEADVECKGGKVSYTGPDTCDFVATSMGLRANNFTGNTWKNVTLRSYAGEAVGTANAISIGTSLKGSGELAFNEDNNEFSNIKSESSNAFGKSYAFSIGFDCAGVVDSTPSTISVLFFKTTLVGTSSLAVASDGKGVSYGVSAHTYTSESAAYDSVSFIVGIAPITPETYTNKMESSGIYYKSNTTIQVAVLIGVGDKAIAKNDCFSYLNAKYGRNHTTGQIGTITGSQYTDYDYVSLSTTNVNGCYGIIDGYGNMYTRNYLGNVYSINTMSDAPYYIYSVPEGKVFSHYVIVDMALNVYNIKEGESLYSVIETTSQYYPFFLFAVFDDVQQPNLVSDAALAIISAIIFASAIVVMFFYCRRE